MTKIPITHGVQTQHVRFLEAARKAGADVDTNAADRLMERLARTKPEPKSTLQIKSPDPPRSKKIVPGS